MLQNLTHSQQLIFIGQVLLSILLGGMLGLQRERWGKWAGPRTYALVCAGSTLFTILSLNFFTNNSTVASAVISGIGFLGAGTILHKENRVEGLTTAAGLWMVSAIGMAVGVGEYLLATVISIIILGVLMFNDKPLRIERKK
ncbi:MAG: MgtC/SapB family protein [Candidatus Magasanikbacteria bacterium]|nr:MgtC/SapB family protein [Candidatus Magasanikbacteria bacterium]